MGARLHRLNFLRYARAAVIGGGVKYLLRDDFTDTRSAGSVNGTAATPGPGTRTVVDTNSIMPISGGALVVNGTPAANDRYVLDGVTRTAGRVLVVKFPAVTQPGATAGSTRVGWSTDATTNAGGYPGFDTSSATVVRVKNATTAVYSVTVGSAPWYLAMVLGAQGGYYFAKIGGNWCMVWSGGTDTTATVYPKLLLANSEAHDFTMDDFRVPVTTWLPTPLAYDTFTRSNGALGSTETTGPDGQAVGAKTWTGATWTVSSNAAINTPTTFGSNVVVNGGFDADSDWTKGTGTTISGGAAHLNYSGSYASLLRTAVYPLTVGKIYRVTFDIPSYTSGSIECLLGSSGFGGTFNSSGTKTRSDLIVTDGRIQFSRTAFVGDIDNVVAREMTVAECISSVQGESANVIVDANITVPTTMGNLIGLVVRLDSTSNPQNFLLALISRANGRAKLVKCVAGTFSDVIASTVTAYVAGAQLRVIANGTSVSMFYNGAQVGTTQTVSDAGILNNTLHGMFGTYEGDTLDNFTVMPIGDGAHDALNRYIT